MEDLLDPQHGIGLEDLKLELVRHHHPKTRKMENGKNRNTQETSRELDFIKNLLYKNPF